MFTLAFKRNARAYLVLCMIFSCVFLLNCLTPLSYGDDYVNCFIWDGSSGWNIYEPLPEDARRVESVADLAQSLGSYYMHWGGRLVGTVLSQFFAWQGKELFNFCNSVIFLVLILEIHALSTGGKMVSGGKAFRFLWIFFALWSFVLGINGVMLWEIGACNYLWTMVLALAFLIPYLKHFRSEMEAESDSIWKISGMGFLGLLAGNTNENTICWLILLLGYDCVQSRREKRLQGWMVSGLAGLALGYLALIFSPGTIERMLLDVQTLGTQSFSGKLSILAAGFLFQFLLWRMEGKEQFRDRGMGKKNHAAHTHRMHAEFWDVVDHAAVPGTSTSFDVSVYCVPDCGRCDHDGADAADREALDGGQAQKVLTSIGRRIYGFYHGCDALELLWSNAICP